MSSASILQAGDCISGLPKGGPCMITGTLLAFLAIAYIVLKISNTRAEFARRDAERLRQQQAAEAAMEEAAEEEEIRMTAIDVEAETIDNDDLDAEEFVVESTPQPAEEEVVIEVPEYETV